MLLADISGFTRVAEQFTARGPEGLERLTALLNAHFVPLVEIVASHGGDIYNFAGDAVLAVFAAEDARAAALAAARCGLAAQRELHKRGPVEGVFFRLRVGIGAGNVLSVSVGGVEGRWKFLAVGDPLTQMTAALGIAHPDDVVVSPQAWALLEAHATGEPMGGGFVRLYEVLGPPLRPVAASDAPSPAADLLRAYVPRSILARLDQGHTEWLAEFRRLTVLFAVIPDLDHRGKDALAQLHAVVQAAQETVYRYDGSISQFLVDDKGPTLLAAWGLPTLTHADDAARAVQAALELQARLRKLGYRTRMGLATGRLFCGRRGNETRREYAMIGSVVNLAERIMEAADELVLCDAATKQAAAPRVAFTTLPPISVRGRESAVAVYRPLAGTSAPRSRGPLVGRAVEREATASCVRRLATAGEGGLVILEGEAGIGKSRLVDDIVEHAHAAGVTTFVGAGDAIEHATAYHVWKPVFAQILGWDDVPAGDARRQRLEQELASVPGLLAWSPLLGAVLPPPGPGDNEVTARMTAQARAESTAALLVQITRQQVARGPTMIVVEDAHWMDSPSWTVAWTLHKEVLPLLLVLATRPVVEAPPEAALLRASGRASHLRLMPLAPDEVLGLVCARLGVDALPAPVAALILTKAEGHPFFSEELACALRDGGFLRVEGRTCSLATEAGDLRGLDFPDTVQGVIAERIDRLTTQQQLSMKVASVIGRLFAFRMVRDVHPIEASRPGVAADLESLHRLELTLVESLEPDLTYLFKHVITQEVAYNLMVISQRRALHGAIAAWYERQQATDLESVLPLLAYHWSRAEVADRAMEYLDRAGAQALRTFANREAVAFFNEALAWSDREPGRSNALRRARREHGRGVAYLGLGQPAESTACLTRAVALYGYPVPTSRWRLRLGILGEIVKQACNRLLGAGGADRAGARREVRLEASDCYLRLGVSAYFLNDVPRLLYDNMRALNLAEAAGPSVQLARGYGCAVFAAAAVPLTRVARAFSRRCLRTAELPDAQAALPDVLKWIGVCDMGVGDWEVAHERLKRSADLAERFGNRRSWEESMTGLGYLHVFRGEFAQSLEAFGSVIRSALTRDDRETLSWGRNGLAFNLVPMGRNDEAFDAVQDARAFAHDRVAPPHQAGSIAVLWLRRGDMARAREQADVGAALILGSRVSSFGMLPAYANVTDAYLGLCEAGAGPRAELLRVSLRACQAFRAFARVFPIGRPGALIRRGLYDRLVGHEWRSRRTWQQAVQAARRLRMPYEEGVALYELGRHAHGAARREHLVRAVEILDRLGAGHYLRRAREEMDR